MYVCYVCRECIESLVLDHIHLRRHEAASELTLPIQCCLQEGCSGSFAKLWNLKTHLTKYYQSCQPNFNVMQFHRWKGGGVGREGKGRGREGGK